MSRTALLMAAAAASRELVEETILAVPGSWEQDAQLIYWDDETPESPLSLPGVDGTIVIQPGPQEGGRLLIQCTGSQQRLWTLNPDRTLTPVEPPDEWPVSGPDRDPGPPFAAGFSPDGEYLLLAPWGTTDWFPWAMALYRATPQGLTKTDALDDFTALGVGQYGIAWSPDGRYCALRGGFPALLTLQEWDADTLEGWQSIAVESVPNEPNSGDMAFSPDSQYLALAWTGGYFPRVYSISDGVLEAVDVPLALSDTIGNVRSPAWSPSGEYLACLAERNVYEDLDGGASHVGTYVQVIDWQRQQLLVMGDGMDIVPSATETATWHPERDCLIVTADDWPNGSSSYLCEANGMHLDLTQTLPGLSIGVHRNWSAAPEPRPVPERRSLPALTVEDFGLSWPGTAFVAGLLAGNGKTYVSDGDSMLVIESTGQSAYFTDFGGGAPSIIDMTLLADGNIVGINPSGQGPNPFPGGDAFVVFDLASETNTPVFQEDRWSRHNVFMGGDGYLYTPGSLTVSPGVGVQRIDPTDFSYTQDSYGITSGWSGYAGFAVVGDIAFGTPEPPAFGEAVFIDTAAQTAYRTDFGLDLGGWVNGRPTIGPDGLVYIAPGNAASVLVVDVSAGTAHATNYGRPLLRTPLNSYQAWALAGNGKMYALMPWSSDFLTLLELDPAAGELNEFSYERPDGVHYAFDYLAVTGGDGRPYFAWAGGQTPLPGLIVVDPA